MNLRAKLLKSVPPLSPSPAQSAAPGPIAAQPPVVAAPILEPEPPRVAVSIPESRPLEDEPPTKAKRPAILLGVKQAGVWLRAQADEILSGKLSEKTEAQHRRNGERLEKMRVEGEVIELREYETSPATFYAYRAAVRWHSATLGLEALKEYNRAKKKEDEPAAAAAWQRVLYAAADLKTYPKDTPGLPNTKHVAYGLEDGKPESRPARAKREGRINPAPRETSKLKAANKIAKNYPNWRELLWGQLVVFKSPWLDHAAIAALTGARPEELRTATFERVGGNLRIKIIGAKVSETKGQEWRVFTLENDGTTEFLHLFNKAGAEWQTVGMPEGVKDYPDAFSAALARAGQKVLPKSARMSGYVYRHALASDLKADGFTREEIAAALGHAVTKTQDAYGRAVGGSAGKRALSVECARAIKVTHDVKFLNPAPQVAPPTMTMTTPNFGNFGL